MNRVTLKNALTIWDQLFIYQLRICNFPKVELSQYTSVMTKPEVWYQYLQLTTIMFLCTNKIFLGYVLVQEVQFNQIS